MSTATYFAKGLGYLDPRELPEEKVIKTLIYGVKSSGNQADRGLRETARLSAEEYPKVIDFWILKVFKMTFIKMTACQGKKMSKKF